MFESFSGAPSGVLAKVFYFATGFGHQAVMVFFVLSGYFITKSIDSAWSQSRWSWKEYLVSRLTRLWVVLLPCLLLTLAWDLGGRSWGDASVYEGAHRETLALGPSPEEPANLSLTCLLGNMAFLQHITTTVYGSNGPLWSLAYEFWYYIVFPLAACVFYRPRLPLSWLFLAAAFALVVWLPAEIRWGGVVWLMGSAVYFMLRRFPSSTWVRHPAVLFLTLAGFVGCLIGARLKLLPLSDLVVGIAFALCLPPLMARASGPALYVRTATHLSDVSYTLYLAHFPVLIALYSLVLSSGKLAFSLTTFAAYGGVFVLVFLYSSAMWWLFERNTLRLRSYLRGKLD